jgi:hypothetical protein
MWNEQLAKNLTYINSQVACALIELEAMKAANAERARKHEAPAYTEENFMTLQTHYGLTHNQVLTNMEG